MATPPATTITILPLGALLQTFTLGPKNTNIVLGFPTQDHYPKHNQPFFGETIGRYANRISNAQISSLNNGTSYPLAANNASNTLHGGLEGWGKKVWSGPEIVGLRHLEVDGEEVVGGESLKYSYRSVHGEEGFPGTVDVSVVYTTGTQDGGRKKVLGIEYEAVLVDDEESKGVEETVVNITNHSYFNLNPENETIEGTEITLATNLHLPLNELGLPTSYTPAPYPGITPNEAVTCTSTTPRVDDCFVPPPYTSPSTTTSIDTRSLPLLKHVSAYHPTTKLHLEVYSTEPSFQFYTGIYIDVPGVESEGVRGRGAMSGFCVEPGRWVDAVNSGVEDVKKQVVLKKGETYGSRFVYRGWSDE